MRIMGREGLMDDTGYHGFDYEEEWAEAEMEREYEEEMEYLRLTAKYFNYDYNKKEYYEVSGPIHDHYTYKYEENAWYEDIIEEV